MQVNSAAEVENVAIAQSTANTSSQVNSQITGSANGATDAGLAAEISNAQALSTTQDASASSLLSNTAANEASFDGLPEGMSPELYEKSLDFAKLSSQAYDWDDYATAEIGMGLFGGISDIKNQDFSTPNYQEIGQSGNGIDWWGGSDQGLDYKLFENTETGDMVLAFRGTEPLSLEDWVEDAEQIFGDSEQYEQGIALARDLQSSLDQYNTDNGTDKQLSFTGHSLGGGLATAAALATDNEAIVFDAAGLSQGTIDKGGLDISNADNITNMNVKGDILSDWNGKQDNSTIISGNQYGEQYWLEGVNDQADFGGWLVPDWTNTAKLAESVLNHAWHVFTYQLENKNFA